jgi:hypothetical protein
MADGIGTKVLYVFFMGKTIGLSVMKDESWWKTPEESWNQLSFSLYRRWNLSIRGTTYGSVYRAHSS